MRCHKCDVSFLTIAKLLQDSTLSLCSICYQVNECRLIQDKRILNLERLRFDILLYEKESLNQDVIERVCAIDIRIKLNAMLIVETRLNVLEIKRLAIELCQLIKASSIERATI